MIPCKMMKMVLDRFRPLKKYLTISHGCGGCGKPPCFCCNKKDLMTSTNGKNTGSNPVSYHPRFGACRKIQGYPGIAYLEAKPWLRSCDINIKCQNPMVNSGFLMVSAASNECSLHGDPLGDADIKEWLLMSQDVSRGERKNSRNPHVSWEILWFPVDFCLNQSIEYLCSTTQEKDKDFGREPQFTQRMHGPLERPLPDCGIPHWWLYNSQTNHQHIVGMIGIDRYGVWVKLGYPKP